MPRASSSFLVASVLVLGLAPAACSGAREDGTEAAAPSPAGSGAVPSPSGTATGQADAEAPVGDAGPQGTYDSKLYVLPQSSFPVTGIGAAIDSLVAAKPAIEGVLIYVHGRSCGGGGEPQKSLESVVPDMETEYAAGVVMFSWPGSDDGCPLGFPEPQARKAGPALRAALASLASYAATSPAALAQRKVTLITHSMGNIVLESALATKIGAPPNLLANAVVQSSATALGGHGAWLSNLDFAERAFVTVNLQDKVLAASAVVAGPRLGHGLGTEKLTSRAAYVDFSAAGVNHQYYVASGQKGAGMKAFYQDVMRGRPYDLAGSSAIGKRDTRDGATVYTFK